MCSSMGENFSASSEASSIVWAKMKYCSYWPARIVKPPPELGKAPKRKLCVFFFGSNNFGFVDVDNIRGFQEYRAKFVNKGKGAQFRLAVQQVDEFLADPIAFRLNCLAKPKNNRITVKKELGYAVKQEFDDDQMLTFENIDVGTKGEERKLDFDVERLKTELDSVKNERSKLVQKNKALSLAIKRMAARIKQLETGTELVREGRDDNQETGTIILGERNCDEPSSSEEDVYEVENIVSHKTKGSKKLFLIHWKGFDSSHDTWERKENLNCSKKLKEYFSKL